MQSEAHYYDSVILRKLITDVLVFLTFSYGEQKPMIILRAEIYISTFYTKPRDGRVQKTTHMGRFLLPQNHTLVANPPG